MCHIWSAGHSTLPWLDSWSTGSLFSGLRLTIYVRYLVTGSSCPFSIVVLFVSCTPCVWTHWISTFWSLSYICILALPNLFNLWASHESLCAAIVKNFDGGDLPSRFPSHIYTGSYFIKPFWSPCIGFMFFICRLRLVLLKSVCPVTFLWLIFLNKLHLKLLKFSRELLGVEYSFSKLYQVEFSYSFLAW